MQSAAHARFGAILAIGLGTTIAIWTIGYVSLMQPGLLIGEGLFALMLIAMLAGGCVIGRFAGGTIADGAAAGAVTGLFNCLIVGALIGADADLWRVALWIGGNFAVPILLGAGGAAVGRMWREPGALPKNWYGVFTKLAAAAVFLLLISGGIVTGWQAGLAVPDWPNSFGHNMILYPLAEMVSEQSISDGVHYEHAHRLYGMLVGLTCIVLAATIWYFDRRRWLGALCIGALALVIVQGILGGTRVTLESLPLALMHGVFGQIVFATICIIAAMTSTTWRDAEPVVDPKANKQVRMAIALIAMLLVQLLLGASYRHLKVDPEASAGMVSGLLHTHIMFAFLVAGHGLFCGLRAAGHEVGDRVLKRTGIVLTALLAVQIVLGFSAWMTVLGQQRESIAPAAAVIVTTTHQATGALLLAVAALLAVWNRRLLVARSQRDDGI